jgi:Trypsin
VIADTANAKIYTALNTTVHPQFDKELFRYDFAIVHINEYVDYITPVRLNTDSSIPLLTDNLTVVGWGAIQAGTSTSNAVYPSTLQKGIVQAMTNEKCGATVINNLALYEGEIFDEMLCAEGLVRNILVITAIASQFNNTEKLSFLYINIGRRCMLWRFRGSTGCGRAIR